MLLLQAHTLHHPLSKNHHGKEGHPLTSSFSSLSSPLSLLFLLPSSTTDQGLFYRLWLFRNRRSLVIKPTNSVVS